MTEKLAFIQLNYQDFPAPIQVAGDSEALGGRILMVELQTIY